MVTVTIPEEVTTMVQRADIECASRREIITYILENNLNVSMERFAAYQKDYDDKYFKFQQMKAKIEKDYVRTNVENPVSWSLNYNTNVVTIVTKQD